MEAVEDVKMMTNRETKEATTIEVMTNKKTIGAASIAIRKALMRFEQIGFSRNEEKKEEEKKRKGM